MIDILLNNWVQIVEVIIGIIVFKNPTLIPKVKTLQLVASEASQYLDGTKRDNLKIFSEMEHSGFKKLADHFNKTVEEEKDFVSELLKGV